MRLKRAARISAGLACLGAVFVTVSPHLTSVVSRAAVVNAPVLSVRSPVDGFVTSDPLAPASAVTADRVSLTIRPGADAGADASRLSARAHTLGLQVAAIETEIAALDALRTRIAQRARRSGRDIDGSAGIAAPDTPYETQRLDEIAIRLADLESRRSRLDAEQAGVRMQLERLRGASPKKDRFGLDLPRGTLVWSAAPARGSPVAQGEEILQLLDCSRRFIEVRVNEAAFEYIRPGATARVRLRGADAPFLATVEAIRGAGSLPSITNLAAQPVDVAPGSLSALLRLAPAEVSDPETASRFCDVGRTADVRFDRNYARMLSNAVERARGLIGRVSPAAAGFLARDGGTDANAG